MEDSGSKGVLVAERSRIAALRKCIVLWTGVSRDDATERKTIMWARGSSLRFRDAFRCRISAARLGPKRM
ncbi:hypothetical protein KC19_7G106300 [Ceratodon purpureus]|uniref:Uncharacterized protein n=1 Tax=Ceratodon purpureus TaxID=3225 RepID=A0A8T0H9N3_CERPU|nr:hypothetical protein KC19_7G106300 [Ceratodon purpureus]